MKKQLLKSIALFGALACTLTASAEKRYLQLNSEYQLQDGGQYVIGIVGTHADNWQPINPLCYTANTDNTGFTMQSANGSAFTDNMVWTAKLDPTRVCPNTNANHNGPHKVFQFTRENGSKALKINDSDNKVLADLTDNNTFLEVVPVSAAASTLTNDPVFQFHTVWNGTRFKIIHAVLPNGSFGWYTRDNNTDWDILKGSDNNAGSSYSSLMRIYLVIDSENLGIAANALWKSFQEEEAAGKGDIYAEKINNLQMPDITDYSAATLETELKKVFKQAVFALDADLVVTLKASAVTQVGSGNSKHTFLGYDGSYVKMRSTSISNNPENLGNMRISNGKFQCYSGSRTAAGYENYASLYVIESFYPSYTVTGVSFTATTTSENENIIVDGEPTTLSSEEQTIVAGDRFIINGNNNAITISDITVKLALTGVTSAIPAQSGWYQFVNVAGINSSNCVQGKYVINAAEEYHYTNGWYPLGLADKPADSPASTYVYVDVQGNNRYLKSANGHYLLQTNKANSTQANTNFSAGENGTMSIGGYWDDFVADNNLHLGSSSSKSGGRWAAYAVDPTRDYDIWTVSITDAPAATEIGENVRIECTNSANKGIAKVYNNGTFFITRGTNLTESDFVADDDPADELTPILTVDNTAKTVTVDYVSKEAYIAYYCDQVPDFYTSHMAQTIYQTEDVEKAIADHCAAITEAAGEDNVLNAEEVTAIKNAFNNPGPFVANLNKTLNGKYVQLRNLLRNTLYLADAQVSASNTSMRAVGVANHTNLNTIWQLVLADETTGTFYLKNYADNNLMQNRIRNNGGSENYIPLAETDGHPFILESYIVNNTPVFGLKDTATTGYYRYLHQTLNDGNRIVKWNTPVTATASGWIATPADCEDAAAEITAKVENETDCRGWIMTLSHADGLSLHSNYDDELHAIKVTYKEPASRADNDYTLAPSLLQHNAEDGTVSFVLSPNDELDLSTDSDYDVEIPLAAVKVGADKYSKPLTVSIHVDENGVVTGIDEVKSAAANAPAAIFDLQGRRLSKPAKGINIINGRKVLVK